MMSRPTFEVDLRPWWTLDEEQTQGEFVAFDVGPAGSAYLTFARKPADYRIETPHRSVGKTKGRQPQTYRVLAVGNIGCELDVTIAEEPFNIHHVQPLGNELLLACARCQYRGGNDSDRNGRVYSREGNLLGEMVLGDGIQSLQTTSQGALWTSYFDEGVFGNYGWNEPIGRSGLVAWDRQGTREYEFTPTGPLDIICDCYAMNVATDRDVWFSYYRDFPLVHLRDRKVHGVWETSIAGSSTLAVAYGYALMDGGYHDRNAFCLLELARTGKAVQLARFEIKGVEGESLGAPAAMGRGDSLNFLSGPRLYRFTIDDALAYHWNG